MIPDRKRFNLGYLPHRTATAEPDAIAIVDLHGGRERHLTYGAMDARMDRVAAAFIRLGLEPGDRVALLIGNRYEYIEAMYGALRAGLCPALVSTKLGLEGLVQSIEECGARAAIVEPDCNASAIAAAAGVEIRIILDGEAPGWSDYHSLVADAPLPFDPPEIESSAVGELCFTSGSTGRPKAVMIPHRATILKLHCYANEHRAMRDTPLCALIHLPIFHANARLSAGVAFETGGTVVIQQQFDARQTLENIAKYKVTYFFNVTPAYVAMLKETDLLESLDFSSLRFPLVGSGPSSEDMLRQVEKAMGVRIMHTYGSTEAGTILQHRPEDNAPLSSCGRPLAGNDIRLVSATGAAGDFGELWVRNEWQALGYWRRPEETAAKFVDGWYRSGDVFERDAHGHFYFRGRTDDMFNVGGEKVYPIEVERLLQRHPAVLAASVVPIAHEAKMQVPAAMVVLTTDRTASVEELKAFCLAHGPAYAHPRRILIVDALPMAGTGKIDRFQVGAALERAG